MKRPNSLLILIFLLPLAMPSAFAIIEQHVSNIYSAQTSPTEKFAFKKPIGGYYAARKMNKWMSKNHFNKSLVSKPTETPLTNGKKSFIEGFFAILLTGFVCPILYLVAGISEWIILLLLLAFILSIAAILTAKKADKDDKDAKKGKILGLITLFAYLLFFLIVIIAFLSIIE